jgi:hypothetical protein
MLLAIMKAHAAAPRTKIGSGMMTAPAAIANDAADHPGANLTTGNLPARHVKKLFGFCGDRPTIGSAAARAPSKEDQTLAARKARAYALVPSLFGKHNYLVLTPC